MRLLTKVLMAAAAMAGGSTLSAERLSPDTRLQNALRGRVAGKPVRCISPSRVTSSEIIDGRAILYRAGPTIYVNAPRRGANSLRSDDILVTRTYGSQLCNIDSVNLVDRTSRFPRGFVILDKFVPYTKTRNAGRSSLS
jgi:hypothetical protein